MLALAVDHLAKNENYVRVTFKMCITFLWPFLNNGIIETKFCFCFKQLKMFSEQDIVKMMCNEKENFCTSLLL